MLVTRLRTAARYRALFGCELSFHLNELKSTVTVFVIVMDKSSILSNVTQADNLASQLDFLEDSKHIIYFNPIGNLLCWV